MSTYEPKRRTIDPPAMILISVAASAALSCSSPQQRPTTETPAAPETATDPSDGFSPAAHYAALFDEGRSMTYHGTRAVTLWDESDPAADEEGNVTHTTDLEVSCTVAEVRHLDGALASRIDCGEETRLIAGVYGATAEGLWRLEALPESAEELIRMQQRRPPLIAAAPELGETRREHGESEPYTEVREVTRTDRGAWCVTLTTSGVGDDGATTSCFAEAAGLVQHDSLFSGGSVIDVHLELEP